jgi:hypothetical protein
MYILVCFVIVNPVLFNIICIVNVVLFNNIMINATVATTATTSTNWNFSIICILEILFVMSYFNSRVRCFPVRSYQVWKSAVEYVKTSPNTK